MELEELIEQIAEYGFVESYYRITLVLPRKMLGNGKKFEIYSKEHGGEKPWTNKDCKIPIKYTEGAEIGAITRDCVEVAYIISLEELVPFTEELWKALEEFDYWIKVKINDTTTMGNET